jgi:hypothetical protein
VDVNTPGTYTRFYSATNQSGAVGIATREVRVVDSAAPTVTLLGANPIVQLVGSSFVDPGATASDVCSGSLSVVTNGAVNPNQIGSYVISYVATDLAGNATTNTRTVAIGDRPSIGTLTVKILGTNAANGSKTIRFEAMVNPNGLSTLVDFEYGLTTSYAALTTAPMLPANFNPTNVSVIVSNFSSGATYHWRATARNTTFSTTSPDQSFSLGAPSGPPTGLPGDINGDGIVSQSELDEVITHYRPTSPWLDMTNAAGLGGTNVTFALNSPTAGAYVVEASTNLTDWEVVGPATPRYEFSDTNAPGVPQRFYRLRLP